MLLQQIHKIWKDTRIYFTKWWNCVLMTMLIGFLLSGLLWLAAAVTIGGWSAYDGIISSIHMEGHNVLLVANSLFSVSSVISVFYLGSLCQVNKEFGPLHLSTLRMSKDIMKFLTIFVGLFFAFTLGVRNLYSYNRSLQNKQLHGNNTIPDNKLGRFVSWYKCPDFHSMPKWFGWLTFVSSWS